MITLNGMAGAYGVIACPSTTPPSRCLVGMGPSPDLLALHPQILAPFPDPR